MMNRMISPPKTNSFKKSSGGTRIKRTDGEGYELETKDRYSDNFSRNVIVAHGNEGTTDFGTDNILGPPHKKNRQDEKQ